MLFRIPALEAHGSSETWRRTTETGQNNFVVGCELIHHFKLVLAEPLGDIIDPEWNHCADQNGKTWYLKREL